MKMLWHRLVSRHKRIKTEVAQLELEMAKDAPLIPVLLAFPQNPNKTSTVILFSVFAFFVTIAVWISFRELMFHFSAKATDPELATNAHKF